MYPTKIIALFEPYLIYTMSERTKQDKIAFPPFMKTGISDIAEKLGVTKAAYIRMCIKKDVDDRGYKKTENK